MEMIMLNRLNHVLGLYDVSTGGQAGTVANPKIVFSVALKANASTINLARYYPSVNLKPSRQNLQIPRKIIEAGKMLDLQVTDHLIITTHGYYSFEDEGLI